MSEACRDPADLVARERHGKRNNLLAAVPAIVVTIAWIHVIVSLGAKARSQGHLADAYYWGYSVPPFVLFEFADKAKATNERAREEAETEALMREQARLTQELNTQPPFAPAGLASEETLAISENRLAGLLDILAKLEGIGTGESATQPVTSVDATLRELARENRREQTEAYVETRAALAFLRTSWGRWSVLDQRVKFEAAEDEAKFKTLYEAAAAAELKASASGKQLSQALAR